eukprot:6570054-Alexandrium_andersonii.AAC.1
MSASLVGSEMCIRDRPHTTQLARCWVHKMAFATSAASSQPSPFSQSCRCLLYTSDAADDM